MSKNTVGQLVLAAWVILISITSGHFIGKAMAEKAQREYSVLITRAAPPAQIIGRIQTGLNKTQAEGVAFQLNEVFTKEHSEWKAIAAVQQDISTLPEK